MHARAHTHTFYGPLSGTTRASWYRKGKTNLDFTEARDSEWQWQKLGHIQVCTLLQTDNHTSTPPLSFFRGWMPFLPPNQQRQSTEGTQSSSERFKIPVERHWRPCTSGVSVEKKTGTVKSTSSSYWSSGLVAVAEGSMEFHDLNSIQLLKMNLQCFDAVGWASERASGL